MPIHTLLGTSTDRQVYSELWTCWWGCRVLTVSFHKFGNYFFPGTGDIKDIGESHGKYYSLNVPMRDGTDDRTFEYLFNPIMAEVMKVFQPGAVVLQCGEAQPLTFSVGRAGPVCATPFRVRV